MSKERSDAAKSPLERLVMWLASFCWHDWKYESGGPYDNPRTDIIGPMMEGRKWGLRYRECTKCGKEQVFHDHALDYYDLDT